MSTPEKNYRKDYSKNLKYDKNNVISIVKKGYSYYMSESEFNRLLVYRNRYVKGKNEDEVKESETHL